ncbi:MAG: HNH endonuclease [Cellvibrionaceae bacterium]|nr:HNH endonuclease [Cellvibrionaceae bacterium]
MSTSHQKDSRWLIRLAERLTQKPLAASPLHYPRYTHRATNIERKPIEKQWLGTSPLGELTVKGNCAFVYLASYENKDDFNRVLSNSKTHGRKVHFTHCNYLKEEADNNTLGRFYSTTRNDGRFTIELSARGEDSYENPIEAEVELLPCEWCIQRAYDLDAKETDLRKALAQDFSFSEWVKRKDKLTLPTWRKVIDEVVGETDWQALSRSLREAHDYRCQACGFQASNDPFERYCIHVHHEIGGKRNNNPRNLRVLCYKCHAKQPNHEKMKLGKAKETFERFDLIHHHYFAKQALSH